MSRMTLEVLANKIDILTERIERIETQNKTEIITLKESLERIRSNVVLNTEWRLKATGMVTLITLIGSVVGSAAFWVIKTVMQK